jgi:outer membrane protein assembly factor BamE
MRQFTPDKTPMRPTFRLSAASTILALGLAFGASGCVYRMAIQQGNFLDAAQVSQLENGMTRSQVAFLLGTPMVPTAFDTDRWDYFYYLKDRRLKAADTRRVTVYFADDKVAKVVSGPDTGEAPHIGVHNRF